MRAEYTHSDGTKDSIEYPVIKPQPMQHNDGFTLLGFDSWEDVDNEKLAGAVTDILKFRVIKENIGFK